MSNLPLSIPTALWAPGRAPLRSLRENPGATSVVANGYVYEIAGINNSTDVEFAAINANGTLGAWQSTTSLPTEESGATSVVANGYVYEIGGANDPTGVEFAALNADGTLGAWAKRHFASNGRIWSHVGCRQRLRL
jgi:aryl carrier-like protein